MSPTDDDSGDPVLGRGLAFPWQLSQGRIGVNAYELQVHQSILMILRTAPGERVMRPDFGGGIDSMAFEPMDTVTVSVLRHRIEDALTRFEPRIDVLSVTATPDPVAGRLPFDIQYRVKRTDSVANLVYPFYVERGEA